MTPKQTTVAVYDTHELAEAAVGKLQKAGYDMKQLSIVGKAYHTDENVAGKFVLIAHGTASEVAHARDLLGIESGEFVPGHKQTLVF